MTKKNRIDKPKLMASTAIIELQKFANPEKAKILSRFFKTGEGEYGFGDIFIGVKVPENRLVAKLFIDLSLNEVEKLLQNKIHEVRLLALIILVEKSKRIDKMKISKEEKQTERKKLYDFYLNNTKYINNWDLIDGSAEHIVGKYLFELENKNKEKKILEDLSRSKNLWERRISILSTFHFIKNRKFDETIKIANNLLSDEHDLIQKAVGWMIREMGKRDQNIMEEFLMKDDKYKKIPRTMLRYAIERLNEQKKKFYLVK